MSNNYLSDPLLECNTEEADSGLNPSIVNRMGRLRARPFHVKIFHSFRTRRSLWILSSSCVLSTMTFSLIFYLNMDHLFAFYDYANYSPPQLVRRPKQTISFRDNIVERKGLTGPDSNITYQDFNYLNPDSLTYKNRTYSHDLQILFRFPEKRSISGVLLIFHGCGRRAWEWFHTVERQRIIGGAIDLGYACLVFQSTDRESRCWSNNPDINENIDAQMVFKGLENFYNEYPKLESLPCFTFGASSGGIFSSIFAANERYQIQGQILFISIILREVLDIYVKAKIYPPTAWIYMLRDIEFASEDRIDTSMKVFAHEKIPHIGFEIEPISLTPTTFHERIPTITVETSRYIVHRLRRNSLLDANNYLVIDPRRNSAWQTFLFTAQNETLVTPMILENLRAHERILPEFLNTVYGEHEISFERSYEALIWLRNIWNNHIVSTP